MNRRAENALSLIVCTEELYCPLLRLLLNVGCLPRGSMWLECIIRVPQDFNSRLSQGLSGLNVVIIGVLRYGLVLLRCGDLVQEMALKFGGFMDPAHAKDLIDTFSIGD